MPLYTQDHPVMSALGTSGIGIIILILLAVPFKSLTTVDANFFPGSSLSAKTITYLRALTPEALRYRLLNH